MRDWQVWIHYYPGTYSTVRAESVDEAIAAKVKEWRHRHHAETVTVRATGHPSHTLYERDCTITRSGEIRWIGKTLVRTTKEP
jgi:hypothetical protein